MGCSQWVPGSPSPLPHCKPANLQTPFCLLSPCYQSAREGGMAGEPQPQPQAASPLGSTCEIWLDRKRPPGATQASALPKARLKPAAAAFVLSPILWSSKEEVGWGTDFLGTPSGITASPLPNLRNSGATAPPLPGVKLAQAKILTGCPTCSRRSSKRCEYTNHQADKMLMGPTWSSTAQQTVSPKARK